MMVPQEPGYTCGEIDAAIDAVDSAQDLISSAERALSGLLGTRGDLERLRKANQELRTWGQYWKDRAEELEEELKNAQEAQAL